MSKELIPFDESTDLVVGKYYNVLCAKLTDVFGEQRTVPIIGPEHKDVQFGFKDSHFHIDGRFTKGQGTNERFSNYDTTDKGYTAGVVSRQWVMEDSVITFCVLRKKCRRLTTGVYRPDIPPPIRGFADWHKNYIGKSCKGRKCPHYGTHMLEVNGSLLCPLHHLKGDIETETIIAF